MPLSGNAQAAKQQVAGIVANGANFMNDLNNALAALNSAGAADSKAAAQSLKDAMVPRLAELQEVLETYEEADQLQP